MLIGVDVDLREMTWVADNGTQFRDTVPQLGITKLCALLASLPLDVVATVLYEIAGAVDYSDNKGTAHNKRRWTIFNVAMAQHLHDTFHRGPYFRHHLVVAPSSVWTKGYPEKQRHKLFACDAATHDLRECQAMIGAYKRDPAGWKPLPDYLYSL